ncbi:MAG: hypothetical protein ACOC1S_03725 [bacterium]
MIIMRDFSGLTVIIILMIIIFYQSAFGWAEQIETEQGYVQLNLKGEEKDSFFEVRVDDRERIYLPAQEVLSILELDMFNINQEENYMAGVIPSLEKEYYFDLAGKKMQQEGKTKYNPNSEEYFFENSSLFIRYDVWGKWLPVEIDWDVNYYEVNIKPEFKLVSEILSEREEKVADLKGGGKGQKKTEVLTPPASFFEPGLVHYQSKLDSNFKDIDISDLKINYTGQLAWGDFTGEFKLGFRDSDLNYFRQHYRDISVMGLEEILIGDTVLSFPSVLSSSKYIRGIAAKKKASEARFGETVLSGYVPAGSKVDLYYQNTLIDYQESKDGTYHFSRIPVQGLNNNYEIIVYTPQGKIYRENKEIVSQAEQLAPGKVTYSLGSGFTEGDFATVGEINYGLSETLTAGSGFYSFNNRRENKQENYWRGKLMFRPFDTINISPEIFLAQNGSGLVFDFDYLQIFKYWVLEGNLLKYKDVYPPQREYRWINGQQYFLNNKIDLKLSEKLSKYNFSLEYEQENFSQKNRHVLATGVRFRPYTRMLINLSNKFSWGSNFIPENTFSSEVYYSGFKNFDLRGSMDLTITEQGTEKKNLGFELRNNGEDNFDYSTGFNLHKGNFKPWAELNYQLNDSLSLSASIQKDKVDLGLEFGQIRKITPPFEKVKNESTHRGWVEGNVFLAQDGSGEYEGQETVFSDVEIMVDNSPSGIRTDENGYFRVSDLKPYEPFTLSIKGTDLDALQVPMKEEIRVETRPGRGLKVDIPIVSVSGIDGYVKNMDSFQEITPGNIKIIMQDKQGNIVESVKPEYDGFYVIDDVKPGEYEVIIETPDDIEKELKPEPEKYEIEIPFASNPTWESRVNFDLKKIE